MMILESLCKPIQLSDLRMRTAEVKSLLEGKMLLLGSTGLQLKLVVDTNGHDKN